MVTGLEAGADDYVGKPYDPAELRARLEVGRRLVELNDELLEASAALEVQARTDALTGLLNRARHPRAARGGDAQRAARRAAPLGVGMVDIDHFKRVNDSLRARRRRRGAAARWRGAMQRRLRPYDSVGRFGGEEFLVLVPGVGQSRAARTAGARPRAVASAPFTVDGHELPVTVSLGGADAPAASRRTRSSPAPTMRCTSAKARGTRLTGRGAVA